jgi:hypothetical protein
MAYKPYCGPGYHYLGGKCVENIVGEGKYLHPAAALAIVVRGGKTGAGWSSDLWTKTFQNKLAAQNFLAGLLGAPPPSLDAYVAAEQVSPTHSILGVWSAKTGQWKAGM